MAQSYKYLIKIGNRLLWKQISREILIRRARPSIEQLRTLLPVEMQALGQALEETIVRDPNKQEIAWIRQIEKLRLQLFESDERVLVHDFGAGNLGRNKPVLSPASKSINLTCWLSAKPPFWCFLLMKLIRAMKPQRCLELGTNLGISTAYQAAALELNGRGDLVTLEGAQAFARKAREHLSELRLDRRTTSLIGHFNETLPLALTSEFDFVFIHGHHAGAAMLKYYRTIRRHLKSPAILVFDDITWSCDMWQAWRILEKDPRLPICLNLFSLGICIYRPGNSEKLRLSIPLI